MLSVALLLLTNTNDAFANEAFEINFEINQKNCNLPMKKIRQLLPEKDDQQDALKRCTEKAMAERWKRPLTLTEK